MLETLQNRYSNPLLAEPAPKPDELQEAYLAMMRAPDHARLKPARMQIWQGEGLERMGDIFAAAALRKQPDLDPDTVNRYRNLPLRAPMVAVVIATIREHPKVPEIEQVISTGCSTYALILALNTMGYGGMWRTGNFAYDPTVKQALGLEAGEHLIGFLYIGTPTKNSPKTVQAPEFSERVAFIQQ